jgi:transcription antitermination protein NusB
MAGIDSELFPLSITRQIKGNRRIAREKALQVLIAHDISGQLWSELFSHIFYREFNIGEEENIDAPKKLLTQDEITDIEADTPIKWKENDIQFAVSLIENAIKHKESIDDLIKHYAKNWDFGRIALIDRFIMRLAAVELLYYSEIPTKVTINEALDIAKKYSTDKSSTFINGILDSIYMHFKKEGKAIKTGRGLKNK